jgi:hypothetical protein
VGALKIVQAHCIQLVSILKIVQSMQEMLQDFVICIIRDVYTKETFSSWLIAFFLDSETSVRQK